MKSFTILGQMKVTIFVLLTFFGLSAYAAFAQSPVKLKGEGTIDFSTEGPSSFAFSGTASHLGQYRCHGEIVLNSHDGAMDGVGGVAVFEAANGDLLVGIVALTTDADGIGQIRFSWRDSVRFSNGTTVYSTGRFVSSRPPGAVSTIKAQPGNGIIAILIG